MAKNTAGWLHEEQRDWVQQRARSWLWRSELPTWILIVAIYGGWFTTLAFWQTLGLLPATLLLIWFTTWYMSLQHELIHGHPTRYPRLNQLLGLMPLAVSYPALALTKVRSFLEHRADTDPLARSVINEASLPWRVLFLNLNYHSVHHDLPGVPWYALRKVYLRDRASYQQRNGGFLVQGYGEWLRHFLWRSVNVNAHPGFNKANGNEQ